ncbi:hypothetical protein AYL99_06265 [Fonsecaea erecta]|uniref:3-oxoacyl-[acyl-carrier protein] reductase n=1 Tax=Fonsecaea erecta TaxID=1367422 RepID=A0A178ZGR0_9EURO|nr:hypothetical protein AYL99_06265 [Fonsecaea erecta]OAP58968.1 hypothetical protein AYL99_06265 [Fonsecaea erecta]
MSVENLFPGVALVTGAAQGIGAGVARGFASAGCRRIAMTDHNAAALHQTAAEIVKLYPETQMLAIPGDISSESFVESFVTAVVDKFGRLDYCVNNAGIIGRSADTLGTTPQDFDAVNAVNYRGCFLCCRAELKVMTRQEPLPSHDPDRTPQRGSIVNTASQLGLVGRKCAPAYTASKAAVIALTRADAIDYATKGIRVNCVCPGLIDTPMTRGDEEFNQIVAGQVTSTPIERMGKVSEVVDCVLFLSSTKASFVLGHAMVVDGGVHSTSTNILTCTAA